MFAIIGATGNVGYSATAALRKAGWPVRAIVRDEAKATPLKQLGCEVVVVNIQDANALAEVIEGAEAVQMIIPLRPRTPDPVSDLRQSGESVLEALAKANTRRALFVSDYGAHVPEDIGLPSLFREFEAAFRKLGGQKIILRSAEYMHNWGRVIPQAIRSGALPSFQIPTYKVQPTIHAPDLGLISAALLLRPGGEDCTTVAHAEGPHRYSADDVAAAVSELSGCTVRAKPIPRTEWAAATSQLPPDLALLLNKADDAKNKGNLVDIAPFAGEVFYGKTTLLDGLRPIVSRSQLQRRVTDLASRTRATAWH